MVIRTSIHNIWAIMSENVPLDIWARQRIRLACAFTSSDQNLPCRHMTLIQRRLNVDATSWHCIEVELTLYKHHVPAGFVGCILDCQRCKVSSCWQWKLIRFSESASWFEAYLVKRQTLWYPSKNTMLLQCHCNVTTLQWRCNDVLLRCVFVGRFYEEIRPVHTFIWIFLGDYEFSSRAET